MKNFSFSLLANARCDNSRVRAGISKVCDALFVSLLVQFAVLPNAMADDSEPAAAHFYRVEKADGVWWIVDANGQRTLSKGINAVRYEGDHSPAIGYAPYGRAVERKYGSREAWADASIGRLRGWGFNTLGSWSDPQLYGAGLAYTHNLNMARSVPGHSVFPDVFSEEFRETADRVAREQCDTRSDDPALLGYFLDNELHWGESWHSERGLLALHFAGPLNSPGRSAAITFLRDSYGTVERFNSALGSSLANWSELEAASDLRELNSEIESAQLVIQSAFFGRLVESGAISREALVDGSQRMAGGSIDALNKVRGTTFASFEEAFALRPMTTLAETLRGLERRFSAVVADRYFEVTTEAIRRHDPNHLILGVRFGGTVFEPVARAMAPYVDIATMNQYRTIPGEELRRLSEWTGLPVIVTEFSFKALDAGVPSNTSASIPLPTQLDRAKAAEKYLENLAALPFVVGYHWFQHADQPASGRFDGENNNFGLVSNGDEPWGPLVSRLAEVNARVDEIHGRSGESSRAETLFNGRDLDGWDTYLGVEEVPGLPFDPFGTWDEPIGRNVDPTGVFSVVEMDGEPAIRISGEIWGALISRSEYEDYHLSLEYKWGFGRHAPRDEAPPNTGLLYHSVGPDGAFWSYWMRSVEFEIMEGRTGDLTSVDGIEATTNSAWDRSAGYPWLRYSESEEDGQTSVGGLVFRIAASENFESPADDWTRVDVLVLGDRAVHKVNGNTVLAIEDLRHEVDGEMVPLTRGALQIQSEGAEVFVRRIILRSIDSIVDRVPAER